MSRIIRISVTLTSTTSAIYTLILSSSTSSQIVLWWIILCSKLLLGSQLHLSLHVNLLDFLFLFRSCLRLGLVNVNTSHWLIILELRLTRGFHYCHFCAIHIIIVSNKRILLSIMILYWPSAGLVHRFEIFISRMKSTASSLKLCSSPIHRCFFKVLDPILKHFFLLY